MMDVNIVSTDPIFCRLLSLEATRLGFGVHVSETPAADHPICLLDGDTCTVLPSSEGTKLLLFGGSEGMAPDAFARFTKPFLLSELRETLLACLVRTTEAPVPVEPEKTTPNRDTPRPRLVIDHQKKTATFGDGTPVKLSDTEYHLLCRLRASKKKPLSAKDVTDILGETDSNKFNVYICYLRRKLERGNLRLIRTVRGKGYTLYRDERRKS